MGKNNAKGGASDKKGKGKEKEKAADSSKGDSTDSNKGLKSASSINARHILVRDRSPLSFPPSWVVKLDTVSRRSPVCTASSLTYQLPITSPGPYLA